MHNATKKSGARPTKALESVDYKLIGLAVASQHHHLLVHLHCLILPAGDPTAVHVQSSEGEALSVLDTPEALDSIVAQCNRKGVREKALQIALKKNHAQLAGPFQANLPRAVVSVQPDAAEADVANGADRRTIQASCSYTFAACLLCCACCAGD